MNSNFINGFEKIAFDGDYYKDGHYFFMANRTADGIGYNKNNDVIRDLRKIIKNKDSGLKVEIDTPDGTSKNPLKALKEIEQKVKEYKATHPIGRDTMNWHRDYVWGVGVKIKDAIGKNEIDKVQSYKEIESQIPNKARSLLDRLLLRKKTTKGIKRIPYTYRDPEQSDAVFDLLSTRIKKALGR